MDWQRIASLTIVGATVAAFLWRKLRPRRFRFDAGGHCGCGSPTRSQPHGSIVFRARKGDRGEIVMKLK